MIAALRKLIIAWMASVLFAIWSGLCVCIGIGITYWLAIDMLAKVK